MEGGGNRCAFNIVTSEIYAGEHHTVAPQKLVGESFTGPRLFEVCMVNVICGTEGGSYGDEVGDSGDCSPVGGIVMMMVVVVTVICVL